MKLGELLVGQLLVLDSFLLLLCLLHNRTAGDAGISQIGCIGVREGAWSRDGRGSIFLHPT